MTASTLITDYMGHGLLANRPTTPPVAAGATAWYYATDNNTMYYWTGSAWSPVRNVPQIRGVNSISNNSATSLTVTFPAGTVAGDTAILVGMGDFAPQTPSGWKQLDHRTGSWWQGDISARCLNASDISIGSITQSFTGGTEGVISLLVVFQGQVSQISVLAGIQSGTGSSTVSLSSEGVGIPSTDYLLHVGGNRNGTVAPTCNMGTLLTNQVETTGASSVYGGTSPNTGAFTETFTYSPAGSGYYQALLQVRA